MPQTRGSDTRGSKRTTRRGGAPDDSMSVPCLNTLPTGTNAASLLDPDAPPTVALAVNGDWAAPPSIGQIEAALTADGRTQHRIWRIDVGSDSAVVHVHPNDVAGCVGIVGTGDLQLNVSVMSGHTDAGVGMGAAMPVTQTMASSAPASVTLPTATKVVKAVPSPVPAVAMSSGAPHKKRAKVEMPLVAPAVAPPQPPPPPPPQLCEAISDHLLLGDVPMSDSVDMLPEHAAPQPETLLAMRAPPQLALSASSDALVVVAPKVDSASSHSRKGDDDKQRRLYRVGLSYRCGRCGKPKKGHVCDQPDESEGGNAQANDAAQLSPTPAILATTVRKGTPPGLLGSPLLASPRGSTVAVASPLADVKVSGEATTIFKDMVAALGENGSASGLSPNAISPGSGPPPPQIVSTGISPLAASAIAAGSVSNAAAAPALSTSAAVAGEPQLSEMDLMLADLAFAARPPPVMTPDEGGADTVANGLGSLSPSNFSPGTMIQQLITTPNGSGWSAAQIAEMGQLPVAGQVASVRRTVVTAQPSA